MHTPLYRRIGSALIIFPGIFVIPLAIGWFFGEAFGYEVHTLVPGSFAVACLTGGIAFGAMVGWFAGRAAMEMRNTDQPGPENA
jgi:cation transporter-like permease